MFVVHSAHKILEFVKTSYASVRDHREEHPGYICWTRWILKQPWLYLCRCIVTPEPERAQLFTPNPKFLCIIALLGFYQLFSNFVQGNSGTELTHKSDTDAKHALHP